MQAFSGRPCTCCIHRSRHLIDARLLAGDSSRSVGRSFSLSEASVRRHRNAHLQQAREAALEQEQRLARVQDQDRRLEGLQFDGGLADRAETLLAHVTLQLRKAEAAGDARTALAAAREIVRVLELQAKLDGSIAEGGGGNCAVIIVRGDGGPPAGSIPAGMRAAVILPDNGRDIMDVDEEGDLSRP